MPPADSREVSWLPSAVGSSALYAATVVAARNLISARHGGGLHNRRCCTALSPVKSHFRRRVLRSLVPGCCAVVSRFDRQSQLIDDIGQPLLCLLASQREFAARRCVANRLVQLPDNVRCHRIIGNPAIARHNAECRQIALGFGLIIAVACRHGTLKMDCQGAFANQRQPYRRRCPVLFRLRLDHRRQGQQSHTDDEL